MEPTTLPHLTEGETLEPTLADIVRLAAMRVHMHLYPHADTAINEVYADTVRAEFVRLMELPNGELHV